METIDSISRRKYVSLSGVAIIGVLVGCLGDNDDDVEGTVETFVGRIDDGDHEAVNELIAEDGEMDEWTPEDAAFLEEWDVELTNVDIVEETEDQAFVDTTVRFERGDDLETDTIEYELRRVDGEWLFWDSDEDE